MSARGGKRRDDQAIQRMECPDCGALPGKPCIDAHGHAHRGEVVGGTRRPIVHTGRRHALSALKRKEGLR
jgi:hypothetical protein